MRPTSATSPRRSRAMRATPSASPPRGADGLLARRDHFGEPGEPAQAPERTQAPGVHAMVRRVEQAQIAPAVAVGPQHRLLAALVREQAARAEVADEPGVLLRAAAVLSLVAAGE